MMTRRFGRATVLVCAIAAIFLLDRDAVRLRAQNSAGLSSSAPQAQRPWRGQSGVTETVGAIMARQQARPRDIVPNVVFSIEHDKRRRLARPNPDAPPVARWPVQNPAALVAGGLLIAEPSLTLPQTVGASFLGTKFGAAPQADSLSTPPDTNGAAGPSQFLVFVNDEVKVLDKAGNAGPLDVYINTFFESVRGGDQVFDPRVVYDRLSGRFFLTALTNAFPNRVLIAVSSGSTITPTSTFAFYQFQHDLVGTVPNGDAGAFLDFDSLGVDAHAAYIGGNVFTPTFQFVSSSAYVVKKSSLLSGGPIEVTAFRGMSGGPYSPRGVSNDDPNPAYGYFVGNDDQEFSRLAIRRVSNPGGSPTLSGLIQLTIPTTSLPRKVPALGSAALLDGNFDNFLDAQMKNGSLWMSHHIMVGPDGVATGIAGTTGRNAVRAYEITGLDSTPTLKQALTVYDPTVVTSGTARNYWMGSVAASGQNHVIVGMSVAAPLNSAGTEIRPSVAVAGRLATDPLGSISMPSVVHQGGNYVSAESGVDYRWGDYSATMVDPSDNMTMWTIQEYPSNVYWAVRVVQLLAPPPATPASVAPLFLTQGATNTDVVVTGTSVNGAGFYDPGPDFPKRLTASVSGGGVVVNSITYTSPTSITLSLSVASNATAGPRSVTVTNPDGQTASAAGVLTVVGSHTIQASAGGHGSISPSGAVPVAFGASQSFNIVPDAGYHVADVLVDGVSAGAVESYTFASVTADHTIAASFAINSYIINATAGAGGSISPAGPVAVSYGAAQSFTIAGSVGFHVADLVVDGVSVGATASYTFANVTANHTIAASFAIDTYTITAGAGLHGSISPAGAVPVNHGATPTFTIAADTGYHVADVLVDGVSAGAVESYTFASVTAAHTIAASFAINTYPITASAGAHGSISPSGAVTVNHGDTPSFTIAADTGYHVAAVLVDGAPVVAGASYTFTNVTAAHTIAASFAINTYAIAAGAGAHGSISPSGAVTVNHGDSQSFTIAAEAGYQIAGVLVDGVAAGPIPAYTFSNVTANHTIAATFAATVQTPEAMIRAIQTTIASLIANQTLSSSETNTLSASLDAALVSVQRGNSSAARGQLGAAGNKVDALVKSKRLAAAQGTALTSAVNAAIAALP